jgi:hypothetical protein
LPLVSDAIEIIPVELPCHAKEDEGHSVEGWGSNAIVINSIELSSFPAIKFSEPALSHPVAAVGHSTPDMAAEPVNVPSYRAAKAQPQAPEICTEKGLTQKIQLEVNEGLMDCPHSGSPVVVAASAHPSNPSDLLVTDQGGAEQDPNGRPLTTTTPLPGCILDTPKHKSVDKSIKESKEADNLRKSPMLSGRINKGKSVVNLAQDLVARKCGIIQEEENLDDMTLKDYMNMYKKPLSKDSMGAILKLTEVAQEKKKKKNKIKKEKRRSRLLKLARRQGCKQEA